MWCAITCILEKARWLEFAPAPMSISHSSLPVKLAASTSRGRQYVHEGRRVVSAGNGPGDRRWGMQHRRHLCVARRVGEGGISAVHTWFKDMSGSVR